ncbi:hydroxyisourate hydrolase [Geomicrobium sp. JCM 19055]|uniref:hydroxyisourate hydrolase n=1 Tax=Geomicrobium sp. JCM 19055 TaxID=1460649 RepID=UPI00045ED4A7|nr:hydroxyisourate hydrolase [Geomicrobium sp. JCM 19055]GAJ99172.1 5-hydroxyisourate hydrolase [Geomicrobium sp. JCM 19055]
MGKVTTHVLDLSNGLPAKHVHIKLYSINLGEREEYLQGAWTNDDGRVDEPLLQGEQLKEGVFELEFQVGGYFNEQSFYETVPIRFKITDPDEHYHVPLLISPWGYQTYRGS